MTVASNYNGWFAFKKTYWGHKYSINWFAAGTWKLDKWGRYLQVAQYSSRGGDKMIQTWKKYLIEKWVKLRNFERATLKLLG